MLFNIVILLFKTAKLVLLTPNLL